MTTPEVEVILLLLLCLLFFFTSDELPCTSNYLQNHHEIVYDAHYVDEEESDEPANGTRLQDELPACDYSDQTCYRQDDEENVSHDQVDYRS